MSRPDPDSFLPLSAAAFYILVALADGDKHGYAVLKVSGKGEGMEALRKMLAQRFNRAPRTTPEPTPPTPPPAA